MYIVAKEEVSSLNAIIQKQRLYRLPLTPSLQFHHQGSSRGGEGDQHIQQQGIQVVLFSGFLVFFFLGLGSGLGSGSNLGSGRNLGSGWYKKIQRTGIYIV